MPTLERREVTRVRLTHVVVKKAGIVLYRTPRDTLEEAIGNDLREERLSPQLICVDRLHYQRPLDRKYVDELADALDDDIERKKSRADIILAIRPDGNAFAINGQHHVAAALTLGFPLVEVYTLLSSGWRFERLIYRRFERWQESVR